MGAGRWMVRAEQCSIVKTVGDRNVACMSGMRLVEQCWAMLGTVKVTSMCNVGKQVGELKVWYSRVTSFAIF